MRHLKDLDAAERITIAKEYLEDKQHMADVAKKHHISRGLTGAICKDFKSGSKQLKKRQQKED